MICLVNSDNERDSNKLTRTLSAVCLRAHLTLRGGGAFAGGRRTSLPCLAGQLVFSKVRVRDALRCSGLHACYNVGSSVFSPIGAPIPRGTGNHPNAHLVGIGDCNGPHEPGISSKC
uniref:Uncharacterized protein n=1 Tax=Anopheles stephensi TaxID=30069 RepID=A0A182YRT7_ANOST